MRLIRSLVGALELGNLVFGVDEAIRGGNPKVSLEFLVVKCTQVAKSAGNGPLAGSCRSIPSGHK